MTIEFYSRLMCEYFNRLSEAVKECSNAIDDMELATEALEKSMPLEKNAFPEKISLRLAMKMVTRLSTTTSRP